MKRLPILVLTLLLAACQAPKLQTLNGAKGPVRAANSPSSQKMHSGLPVLSPALLSELALPDEEADPDLDNDSSARLDETLLKQTIGSSYIKSHSYYFTALDQGKSSVEAILAHDGHSQAASLVRHWAKTLGENALWPDQQSTTYQGRWPALEHAELKRNGGWFSFRSAGTKAEEYYQRARQSWKPQLPADHPEQAESWAWLGRASHFLQDVTVPFHTVSLLRPAQLIHHNAYEKTCDQLFWNYLPSRNHNPGGVWVHGPYPSDGSGGLYFAPGMNAEAMIRQNADFARRFYKLVNEREDWNSRNWDRTRAVMLPLGAKTTAGLIVSFLRDVNVN